MDAITIAALKEFAELYRMNTEGFSFVEAAIRARALQSLSALSTEELARLEGGVAARSALAASPHPRLPSRPCARPRPDD